MSKWIAGRELLEHGKIEDFQLLDLADRAYRKGRKLSDGERLLRDPLPLVFTYGGYNGVCIRFDSSQYATDDERDEAIEVLKGCQWKKEDVIDLCPSCALPTNEQPTNQDHNQTALVATDVPPEPNPAKVSDSQPVNLFEKKGDFWAIEFEGKEIPPMSHLRGFGYLAYLINLYVEAGGICKEISAWDLDDAVVGSTRPDMLYQNKVYGVDTVIQLEKEGLQITGPNFEVRKEEKYNKDEVENRKAEIESLKSEIISIRGDLAEAERNNDRANIDRFTELRHIAEAQLLEICGSRLDVNNKAKRSKHKSSDGSIHTERIQKTTNKVSEAIRRAYEKLENTPTASKFLAHLSHSIQTGNHLSYNPAIKTHWKISLP